MKETWAVVLSKPNQGKPFIEFSGELMNVGINYDDDTEKINPSDRITGVETEEEKVSNPRTTNLSYREAVRTGSGKKKDVSTYPPQECVERPKKR